MTDTQALIGKLKRYALIRGIGQEINEVCSEAAAELTRLTTALTEAEAKLAKARGKLGWYADSMCEGLCEKDGRIAEAIGEDVCAGCPARACLAELGEG